MNRLIFFLFSIFVHGFALADYYAYAEYSVNGGYSYVDDPVSQCSMAGAATNVSTRSVRGQKYPSLYYCDTKYKTGELSSAAFSARVYTNVAKACPFGGILNSTEPRMCVGGIEPPPCVKDVPAGTQDVTTGYVTGPSVGSAIASRVVPDGGWSGVQLCDGRCMIQPSAGPDGCFVSGSAGPNGYHRMHCSGAFQYTGSQCTVGPTTPSPDGQAPEPSTPNSSPDGKCPAGSVSGGQDSYGMTICIGTAKPSTPPVTTTDKPAVTTPNPGGGSTTTKEDVKTNSDGSTTTTTTTTVVSADGTKTTTVGSQTSPKPSGVAGTSDKPEDKYDLCKQNPHLTICQNSQVLGNCADVRCTGDAIQCATLRAASAMECRDKSDREELSKSALKISGESILSGADPQKSAINAALTGTVVDLSNPNLDTSGFIGGGACFAPMTFFVMGRTVTHSFSSICENIIPLRYAIMLCASIISYLIVARTILGS